MKIEQENTQSMPALLCNDCGVDAQETKSLCCEAAGIIDPVSATAEALIPHEKLREAASVDATLIAQERPPAQPVVGYKPLSQPDERAEYEKEFPVPEGLQYCANRDTYIRAAGSSPSDKFAREHYAYRAGFAAWMRRAWEQVSTDLATEGGDGFTCWGTKTQPSAVPLTAHTTHQFIANQAAAALTDTFRAYTGEETAWCAIKAEELEQLKNNLAIYQTGYALLKEACDALRAQLAEQHQGNWYATEDVDRLVRSLSTLLPYAENEAACLNCEESADKAWAAVEEARERLELFNRQQSRAALSASVEPAKCCNCGACPAGCVGAARAQESAPICSCPSGDGSLRWPCKAHPPVADGVGADPMYRPSNAQEASE